MADIGVIGMGPMGYNLACNMADNGFKVAVFNRTTERMTNAVANAKKTYNLDLIPQEDITSFVSSLEQPRRIVMMVQAGKAVDATLQSLIDTGLLTKGDIVVDGGNEFYTETERRHIVAEAAGVEYVGMGVSGGEEGARYGPALMVGGSESAYERLSPILTKIAAKVTESDGSISSCCDRMGSGGAGNYVKMVHNGIEYGDMQLIGEVYGIMRDTMKMSNADIAAQFTEWNKGRLDSYLIEITTTVLTAKHPDGTTENLIDDVLDIAGAKGTGRWTALEALKRGVPCPTIQAAVDARHMSMCYDLRKTLEGKMNNVRESGVGSDVTLADLETALYLSKICSYSQGMMLLDVASTEQEFNIDPKACAAVWRGGCIIRATLLKDITNKFEGKGQSLIECFVDEFTPEALASWRRAVNCGVVTPALSASLQYFTTLTGVNACTRLIQGQRDLFGAHTFQRVNNRKPHHADWVKGEWVDVA